MNKNIIDGLRFAYEAYCRGDIEGAVDAIDLDPDILWIEPKEFYACGTYRGRQGVINYLTLAYSATEQVQNVPEEILVEKQQDDSWYVFQTLSAPQCCLASLVGQREA